MAKNSIRDYSNTAASNTDVQSINIDEGMSPANVNDAIRAVMADLADVNDGTISLVSPDFDAATIGSVAIDAFPSGTKMLFQQSSAPTGWTKETTHNNKALRLTTGSVTTGGTQGFTSAFDSYTPAGTLNIVIGDRELTAAMIPSHFHYVVNVDTNSTPVQINESVTYQSAGGLGNDDYHLGGTTTTPTRGKSSSYGGSNPVHDHPVDTKEFTGTASNQFDVQYVDVIIAAKD
jgi:hypothetical protein